MKYQEIIIIIIIIIIKEIECRLLQILLDALKVNIQMDLLKI